MSHSGLIPDEEVILLRGAWELIDEMVNFALLDLLGKDPDSEVRFHTHIHQRYFNVLLTDFLSRTDRKLPLQQTSFLGGLRAISMLPRFDRNRSVDKLGRSAEDFSTWLDTEVEVDIWMPSIDVQAVLTLRRLMFLKLCGNVTKHSFLRSAGFAEELRSLLSFAGHDVTLDRALLALGDFYERFHTDILNYHASTLGEFLNNLRWGIYEYLRPEYDASVRFEAGDPPAYHYEIPDDLNTEFAKTCYWDLMNGVRSEPYMRRFEVTRCLKLRY
jgi:hypothetical protein